MKLYCLVLLISLPLYAMDDDIENPIKLRPSSTEIASKIASVILEYDHDEQAGNDQFKQLVVAYFDRESQEIEQNIQPLLRQKLRDSDRDIEQILQADDRAALERLVNKLITDSLEDAFKNQSNRYDELKAIADQKSKNSKIALATAIVTGALSIVGAVLAAYFGKS